MSFANFLEKKISYKSPTLYLDDYKDKLSEYVFSLQKTGGLSRHFINLPKIEKLLYEINYPDKEKFLISITSGNMGKIRKLSLEFNEWCKNYNSKKINDLQNYLVKIKSLFYVDKELGIDDAKEIIESKLKETEFEAKTILHNIDSIIRLSDWGHIEIFVEPIFEDSGDLIANEFYVRIGDNYFIYEKNAIGNDIKNLTINESQIIESEKLLWLKNKMNKNVFKEFIKLYFIQPIKNRNIFEQMKKDLALGRPVSFPKNIILFDNKPEFTDKDDVWQVKMERKYLSENSNTYEVLGDEVPFRWLEMVKKNEK